MNSIIPSLVQFTEEMRAINPIEASRHSQGCDWVWRGQDLFHNRTYIPWSPFREITEEYWPECVYTDHQLAEHDAKEYGGGCTECFYSNGDQWFVLFTDIDKATRYIRDQLIKKESAGLLTRDTLGRWRFQNRSPSS